MNLKLNIYNNGQIVKTYEATNANISVKTAKDLLKIIDVDKLTTEAINNLTGSDILTTVVKSFPLFYPIISNIFAGITEEEFETCNFSDITNIIIEVLTHTIQNLFGVAAQTKN